MMAFLAIIKLTCLSALRSRFFAGVIVFFLAAISLIPWVVESDGTAIGMIKITLEYSLAMTVALLSISAVWLATSEITEDLEDCRLQMIVVKPIIKPFIFLAKYIGILLIHGALLLIAAVVIYTVTMYRVETADFSDAERQQLENEVLTGRRVYTPDFEQEDIDAAAEKLLEYELSVARSQGKEMPDAWLTVQDKTGNFDRAEILRRLQDRIRMERAALQPGKVRTWTFSNLPEDLNGPIRIRYKIYTEEKQLYQGRTHGAWGWQYYSPLKTTKDELVENPLYFVPRNLSLELISMQTTEFGVAPLGAEQEAAYVCAKDFQGVGKDLYVHRGDYPGEGSVMVKDGKGTLLYWSLDKSRKSVYFMPGDGPYLLVPVASFFENYCRTIIALFIQIAVFAAMGISFSACFSLATGIFMTLAYLILGISTRFVMDIFTNTVVRPHNALEFFNYYSGKYIDLILLDPARFAAQEMLSNGELVENTYLLFLLLVEMGLKILPFMLIGIYVYSTREIALAGRNK